MGTIHRLRAAIERDGVWTALKRGVRRVWQRSVYRQDEVLVFHHTRGSQVSGSIDTLAPIDVVPIDLRVVRNSAADHVELFTPAMLDLFEDTLRRGERGFMVTRNGKLIHYSWLAARNEVVAASEVGEACRLSLDRTAAVIYHCWTAPAERGQGIYARVLRRLCQIAADDGLDAWIYCVPENTASIAGIRTAGFALSHRFRRRRLFGVFDFHHVSRAMEG
jgi:GNAT superfamily N-acetyltransferase